MAGIFSFMSTQVGGPIMLSASQACVALLIVLAVVLAALWSGLRQARAAHQMFDLALANIPAVIFIDFVAANGKRSRKFISRNASRLAGGSWEDMRANPCAVLDQIDPQDIPAFTAFREQVVKFGHGSVEYRLRHLHGGKRTLRNDETCLSRKVDGSMLVVGFVVDITETVADKQRMRQMERLSVIGEVASGIAHEINQPLSAIAMAAENGSRALSATPVNASRGIEKFSMIKAQAGRISSVIRHIKVLGRVTSADAEAINVADAISEAKSLVEASPLKDGVQIHLDVAADLPPVIGVGVMLEQVMLNLIVNASDAYKARPDIGERSVTISARRYCDKLRICVADRAGGIAEELLARVFDPFVTTKALGEGTGLGLSISRSTISEMGGNLSVRNENGGAVFTIDLPVMVDHLDDPIEIEAAGD